MVRSLFVKVNGKFHRIGFDEIYYIEADRHYVRIYTDKYTYYTYLKLNQLEEELPCDLFCRTNRSYIVSINKIEWFDHHNVQVRGISIPISSNSFEILKSKILLVINEDQSKNSSSQDTIRIEGNAKAS